MANLARYNPVKPRYSLVTSSFNLFEVLPRNHVIRDGNAIGRQNATPPHQLNSGNRHSDDLFFETKCPRQNLQNLGPKPQGKNPPNYLIVRLQDAEF